MLLISILVIVSFLTVHYSVYFLDAQKASPRKAAGVVLCAFILNNLILFLGGHLHPLVAWVAPILSTLVAVWGIYKLKPIHSLTVVGCCVASRLAVIAVLNVLPTEVLNA